VVTNRALPFTVATFGFWVLLVWFALAGALLLRLREDPFLGWANVASRTLTVVGLLWIFCVIFLSWVFSLVMAPRVLRIGVNYVEGSPPRLYGSPPSPRRILIRFSDMGSVGWNLLGPSAVGGPNSPRGSTMLLSYRNLKLIRHKWADWKRRQERGPFTDLPRIP
jgi:hypothetical protein